jgi:hypothetical protein
MPVKYTKTREGKEYERKLGEDAARKTISFTELFTDGFMQAHTPFATMQEMLDKSGAESLEVPAWEAFVTEHTRFQSWQEMLQFANAERVRRLANP